MSIQRRERSQTEPRSGSRPAAAKRSRQGKSPNEGEGSRSAARDYNRRTERFIQQGRVDQSAEDAKRAVESEEGRELSEAERVGRGPRRT